MYNFIQGVLRYFFSLGYSDSELAAVTVTVYDYGFLIYLVLISYEVPRIEYSVSFGSLFCSSTRSVLHLFFAYV